MTDDNEEIMTLLQSRLNLGKQRYGQGVRVDDEYDWEIMALEEILDGMIYMAAQILRVRKKREELANTSL